jgi:hypothetical protein
MDNKTVTWCQYSAYDLLDITTELMKLDMETVHKDWVSMHPWNGGAHNLKYLRILQYKNFFHNDYKESINVNFEVMSNKLYIIRICTMGNYGQKWCRK